MSDNQKPKKHICFHTGSSILTLDPEATISKLSEVIDTFIEKKEDIFVSWVGDSNVDRILNSSVGSRQLYESFYACIEKLTLSGAGEYLETADADRMVACCDAYYGDCSFHMGQFIQAGKPVMQMDL